MHKFLGNNLKFYFRSRQIHKLMLIFDYNGDEFVGGDMYRFHDCIGYNPSWLVINRIRNNE
jgi:hypothetical protein